MSSLHLRPEDMVEEMIEGYVRSNCDLLEKVRGVKAIRVKNTPPRVMVIAGGGAGCEPMYLGYAGEGMADAIVSGNIFAAPSATALLKTIRQMYHEDGVVMITGNYIGDVLNYELAVELCGYEGIQAKAVFVKDDILHASKESRENRRGITGIMCVIKAAAGAAASGLSLAEVEQTAIRARDQIGSVSVTFWPGYRPETGKRMYEMDADTIEVGMGFNGEPGILQMQMPTANQLAEKVLDYLISDMNLTKGDEVLLVVNGKGATSNMELSILSNSLHVYLKCKEISVYKTEVGNFFTAPGMGGISVTLMKMDPLLKRYYNLDSYTPLYTYRAKV
ncbi:MAG: dihydroxyacetone kinase subunit DhaK [Clostridiales bacterium]|nr:dihydroxyacetone kinase subunit DhaK [Clostridiales bacterium]MDU3243260.1 dihydroxyacetone kinase subunit DhaK [Clostridiales bacterium]